MRKAIYTKHHRAIVERLRCARHEAGLTQVEAAKRLRRHQSFVSRCEMGDHRLDVIELDAFARAYGKPLEYFTAALRG